MTVPFSWLKIDAKDAAKVIGWRPESLGDCYRFKPGGFLVRERWTSPKASFKDRVGSWTLVDPDGLVVERRSFYMPLRVPAPPFSWARACLLARASPPERPSEPTTRSPTDTA